MYDRNITEDDRRQADVRARWTKPGFKDLLRRDLDRCLDKRECVTIAEFVDYFNSMNTDRGYKPLDTHKVKYAAYFEALTDVCWVNEDYTHLYPLRYAEKAARHLPRERTASQPRSANAAPPGKSWRASCERLPSVEQRDRRSLSLSPTLEINQQRQKAQALRYASTVQEIPRNLTVNEVRHILVAFTHELSGQTLTWQEYRDRLKEYHQDALHRLSVLRLGEELEFVKDEVSGVHNKIDVSSEGTSTTLLISECSCCRSSPKSPSNDDHKSALDDDAAFSSAIGLFKKIDWPLDEWREVDVGDVDPLCHKLRFQFYWKNKDFEKLHAQLGETYRKNQQTMHDIKVGTVCAVPFEGTKDYHRGVVKDISDPSLPVVSYIDLGTEQGVAKGCLRKLDAEFYSVPMFCLVAQIQDSLPFAERIHRANKLRKKERIMLKAEKYDKTNGRYIVLLETDSGIISDSN